MRRRSRLFSAIRELFRDSVPTESSPASFERHPTDRVVHPRARRRLELERLEDRRVLSVFYEIDVVASAGTRLQSGETITEVLSDISVNQQGDVAFVGNLDSKGQAVLFDQRNRAPEWVSESEVSPTINFAFPQINKAGNIIATELRDLDGNSQTPPEDSSIKVWDGPNDGIPEVIAAQGDMGPKGLYTRLSAGSLADDGTITFMGESFAAQNGANKNLFVYDAATATSFAPTNDKLAGTAYPLSADGDRAVVFSGTGDKGAIKFARESAGTVTLQTIAEVGTNNWTKLGAKPGISEDGKAVVFAGNRGEGDGIFIAIDEGTGFSQTGIHRVAGEMDGPTQIPNLGYDVDWQPIYLDHFEFAQRVGVTRLGSVDPLPAPPASYFRDSYVVAFVATPNRASVSNVRDGKPPGEHGPLLFSEKKGVWTVRVDASTTLNSPFPYVAYHAQSPRPVLQAGDKIGDAEVDENLSLYDPISAAVNPDIGNPPADPNYRRADHYVAFVAGTTMGNVAIRAKQFDTDADGLLDHWERPDGGIDIDQDGSIDLRLADYGANYKRKDVFLEVDWAKEETDDSLGNAHRNEPAAGTLELAAAVFQASPIANPDGSQGITLHIDAGNGFDARGDLKTDPPTTKFSQNMPPGARLQGGDPVSLAGNPNTHLDVVYLGPEGLENVSGVTSRSLQNIKQNFFGTADKNARELAFHYAFLADFQTVAVNWTSDFNAVGGTRSTLTSASNFAAGNLVGRQVYLSGGTGEGQTRMIASNTANEITVTPPWFTAPDSSTLFQLSEPLIGQGHPVTPSTSTTLVANGLPFGNVDAQKGNSIKIINGTGAGQVRRIRGNSGNTLTIAPPWQSGMEPDETSRFAILDGSSGVAEVDFYPSPDNHGIPGNDLLVTLGAFGMVPVRYKDGVVRKQLANNFVQSRTLVHELGHNLGLRHCGVRVDSSYCTSTDTQPTTVEYLSLMSYEHQLTETSPVFSYSSATDKTFDDWSHLRMDFQSTNGILGVSPAFSVAQGAAPEQEMTLARYEAINGSEPDDVTPTVDLLIDDGSDVPKNRGLVVDLTASDDRALAGIVVYFDRDGDGLVQADEQVVAEGAGTEYKAALGEITGPAGDRELIAIAYDSSGNFMIDSVMLHVDHDFEMLPALLREMGVALQEALPEIPEEARIPYVDNKLDQAVDFIDTFSRLANRMYDDAGVVAPSAPPSPVLARDAEFLVNVGGQRIVNVVVPRSTTTTNASVTDLIIDVNLALSDAGLDGVVTAVNDGGALRFDATNDGTATSISVSTLRLAPGGVPAPFGQPGVDVTFELEIQRGSTVEPPVLIELPRIDTDDNVDVGDLAADLNLALADLGRTDLIAIAGVDGRLRFAAIDPTITGIKPLESVPGNLGLLGFAADQIGQLITEVDFPELGLSGLIDVSDLRFASFEEFGALLAAELDLLSGGALPDDFNVGLVYEESADTVYFDFRLVKAYEKSVELDLIDAGIDLGILGTIELAAIADGTFEVVADLGFRVGAYLGGLGLDFQLDATSPLTSLNAGGGIQISVGTTATDAAPADGRISGDISVRVTLTHENAADDSVHVLTLRRAPNPSDPNQPASEDNFDVASLVSDLNLLLERAGIRELVEFRSYARDEGGTFAEFLAIRGTGNAPANVSPLRDLVISDATALGFAPSQRSDYPDLRITLGTPIDNSDTNCSDDGNCAIDVALSGARTVQDIIDRISSATGGLVQAEINVDGSGLQIQATGQVLVEQAAILTNSLGAVPEFELSLAGLGLGILGEANVELEVNGDALHGETLTDRLFILESSSPNLSFTASLTGRLDMTAALGHFLFVVTTDAPFTMSVGASASLQDPNADDGRITLTEILQSPAAIAEVNLNTLIPTASGTLTATPISVQPWYSEDTTDLSEPLFQLTFRFDDATGFGFDADLDFQNLFSAFKDVSVTMIIDAMSNFANQLEDETAYPWLNVDLPLLNKPLNEVLGFVDVLRTTFQCLPEVGDDALLSAVGAIGTAISNLSMELEDRDRLLRMQTLLLEVVSAPQDPALIDEYSRRLPTRLISGSAMMSRIIAQDVPDGTPGLDELVAAVAALEDLFCSWETIELRLETKLHDALQSAVGDAIDVDVNLGLSTDFDGDPDTKFWTVLAGITLSADVSEDFTPDFPVSESMGPLEFEVAPVLTMVAGFRTALGLAIPLKLGELPLVVVDPPTVDPPGQEGLAADLTKTRVEVTVGFNGAIDTGISFGSLDLAAASGQILLAEAITDEDLPVNNGSVLLSEAPIDDDENRVLVKFNGDLLSASSFQVAGRSLTFLGTAPAGPVKVTYQTATTPGTPLDLINNDTQRAGLVVDFVPSTPITVNTAGAVPLGDLPSLIGADVHGMLSTTIDVAFLGATVPDAVTLAASMSDLSLPQFSVDEEGLLSLFTNIDFNLTTILLGLETLLTLLETGLTSDIVAKLPVVGGGFDTAGTFLGTLRDDFVTPFRIFIEPYSGTVDETKVAVQRKVFELLGPGLDPADDPDGVGINAGVGLLSDRSGDSRIDLNDVVVTLDNDHFEIFVSISGRDEMTTSFELGLDGLPIRAEGQGGVEFGIDYAVDIGFGVDRLAGPYFLTNEFNFPLSPPAEFALGLDAQLSVDDAGPQPVPTALLIDLFGLKLQATDILKSNGDSGTSIRGDLQLDLLDTDGDGKVFVSEMASQSFAELFGVALSADVDVNLRLSAGLGSNMPQVQTELVAGWSAGLSIARGELTPSFEDFDLRFRNTGVNLGNFLKQHVGLLLDRLSAYIEPIEPVIRLLKQNVPGVSEVSKAAGKGTVTFLDLALARHPDIAATARKFVDALDSVLRLSDSISTLDNDDTVFVLMDDTALASDGAEANSESFAQAVDVDQAVADSGGQNGDPATSTGASKSILQQLEDLGLHLYFLDVQNDLRMLLGQPFDVLALELPEFVLPIEFQAKFPAWPIPPINIRIGLNAEFSADLSVGYDGFGVRTGNFYDGFYFGDREDVFVGPDIADFGLSVGVSLAALLDALIASAGVEGEIRADILANWRDLDGDGKVRLGELETILKTDGLECVFDLTGQFRAIVRLVWEVLGEDGSHEFINKLLYSFKNQCPTFELGHVSDGGESLPGGPDAVSIEGMLIVHTGAFADLRGPGKTSDVTEVITVTELAPGVVEVRGMGLTSRYAGVTKIFFDGGLGNDSLTTVDVTVPVIALGGEGNDTLLGGSAADYLDGGAGNDTLSGLEGRDSLYGGSGDDDLDGGANGDWIEGGEGDDDIDGGNGADDLFGNSGRDTIRGGAGNDTIDAGADQDIVFGGPGNDTIEGGADDDLLLGDEGDDTVRGGSGSDFISGGFGADLLYGDSGNDLIVGGIPNANAAQEELAISMFALPSNYFDDLDPGQGSDGADELWGGLDNDLLIGDADADKLLGGWGNDQLVAHLIAERATTLAEHLEGGPNNDFICGADGADTIYGGTSDLGLADILAKPGGATNGGFTAVSCDATPVFRQSSRGSLSGSKFDDRDGDGVWDTAETGLAGWEIELFDDQGELVASTLTDAQGAFQFASLRHGTYELREVIPRGSGYVQTYPVSGVHSIALNAGQAIDNLLFGNLFQAGAIRGQQFNDLNGDGTWDRDEPGVNGWQVELFDARGTLLATSVTHNRDLDADGTIDPHSERGWYEFTELPDGDYEVRAVSRASWIQTAPQLSDAKVELAVADDGFTATESDAFVANYGGVIEQIEVALSLDHSAIGELNIWLVGPEGTRVDLARGVGGNGDNFTDTVFDDAASIAIDDPDAEAPYRGSFRPIEPLSAFHGINAAGSWTLFVQNMAPGAAGRLKDWSLSLEISNGSLVEVEGGSPSFYTQANVLHRKLALGIGEKREGLDFGSFQAAEISARKYLETSENLPARLEPGLAGVTIYADLNDNQQLDRREPHTRTLRDDPRTPANETGSYHLLPLPPGDYFVREIVPDRSEIAYPSPEAAAPGYYLQPASGQRYAELDFGNRPLGDISGTKWLDENGNGRRDRGEPGLAGVTIFIDINGDGLRNANEPTQVTRSDDPQTPLDEAGSYQFKDLPVGRYEVHEVVPEQMTQTSGGMQTVYREDFDGRTVGGEWSSNLVTNAPLGDRRFLGPFANQTVSLSLNSLPAHEQLTVSFDLLILGSWDGNHPVLGPDQWLLSVDGAPPLFRSTFSNAQDDFPIFFHNPVEPFDINRDGFVAPLDAILVINELNGNGSRELPLNALNARGLLFDVNADSFFAPLDAILIINWLNATGAGPSRSRGNGPLYPQSFPDAWDGVSIANHPPRTGAVELNSLGFDRFLLPAGHALAKRSDAVYHLSFTFPHVRDSVQFDFAGLGLRNIGALQFEKWGLDNVVVGIPRTYHVVDLAPFESERNIDFGNAPGGGVSGLKWDDIDGDGRRDANEPGLAGVTIYWDANNNGQLDPGERSTTSQDDRPATAFDETGSYLLQPLPPGTLTIREVVPAQYRGTYPQSGFHRVEVRPGQISAGRHFGNQLVPEWDYGDNPDVYHTLQTNQGARHQTGSGLFLGDKLDSEPDGQPTVNADGDDLAARDDEDGVRLTSAIARGQLTSYEVLASQDGFLNAWIDLNNDGDWLDPFEQIATAQPLSKGANTLTFAVPDLPLPNRMYARFRFSSVAQLSFLGTATDGEVEDYRFPVGQGPNPDGESPVNTVKGNKWNDRNANGVRGIFEEGIAHVTIYADLNNNGTFDATEPFTESIEDDPLTADDETGNYVLTNLPDGSYAIRELVPAGFAQTFPATGFHTVAFAGGGSYSDLDFGNWQTGIVYGFKFLDLDGDGERDPNEPGMDGVVIFADLNGNGKLDDGEPSTTTRDDDPATPDENEKGTYELTGLPVGPARIYEKVPRGSTQTFPPEGYYEIFIDPIESLYIGIDFGNTPSSSNPGAIRGHKWSDLDGDGVEDANEVRLAGVTVYLDDNNNGSLDANEKSTVTLTDDPQTPLDETGLYQFLDVDAGSHYVRELVPAHYRQTYPSSGYHFVTVPSGQIVNNVNFANQPLGEIRGRKWEDLNGNGERDADEPGLAGVRIFLDTNDNARWDNGEPFAITQQDDPGTPADELGKYAILDIVPQRTYQVREVVPAGYLQTYPFTPVHFVTVDAGAVVSQIDFGNQRSGVVRGLKWIDENGNGDRDRGEPGMAGVTIYADKNNNGELDPDEYRTQTGEDLPGTAANERGTYSLELLPGEYRIREIAPAGYKTSYPLNGHRVQIVSGVDLPGIDFGNLPIGDISGTKWNDLDADGVRDANEPLLPGVTIYVDVNRNGRFDNGEPSLVTGEDDPGTAADESGSYLFENVTAGDLEIREIAPAGFYPTYPTGGVHRVTLGAGEHLRYIDFGNHEAQGTVSGTKWLDATGALGVRELGDVGAAGVTVFVDLNNNGRMDAGEPRAVSESDNPNSAAIDETGRYTILQVPPGEFAVLEVLPNGYLQSFPLVTHRIVLSVGQSIRDIDFGNYLTTDLEDGDDLIYAGGGGDLVYGDNLVSDPRVISTGSRRDTIHGEAGSDQLFGQERTDHLWGEEDADEIDGGEGADWVHQISNEDQTLSDTLLTGQGPDTLLGASVEHAELTGQDGDNRIDASAFTLGSVVLKGGAGRDVLIGTPWSDELYGEGGGDTLRAGAGNDLLDGGLGSDTLEGDDGNDRYMFGPSSATETDTITESSLPGGGVDELNFSALLESEPVTVDLQAGTGSHGTRTLQFTNPDYLENVLGGLGPDILIGSVAANYLYGDAGDDELSGLDGNDTLVGGLGSDRLDGGPDDDLYTFEDGWGNLDILIDQSGFDTIDMSAVTANLTVRIGLLDIQSGTDRLIHLGNSVESILTGSGDDLFLFNLNGAMLAGGTGTIDAGSGHNSLDYFAYDSNNPVRVDLLTGEATGTAGVRSIQDVFGGAGDDELTGDGAANLLHGRAGDDQLAGGAGDDILIGGLGDDTLRGQRGNDSYLFFTVVTAEHDIVAELDGQGADTLDFSAYLSGVRVDLSSLTLVDEGPTGRTIDVESPDQNLWFERVVGSAFNDEFVANGMENELAGGRGDDVYFVPADLEKRITLVEERDGGEDAVDFQGVTSDVVFDLGLAENLVTTGAMHSVTIRLRNAAGIDAPDNFEVARGGAGDDTLIGNDGNNRLFGRRGNDSLFGGRGNDLLAGGAGTNKLDGGTGNDIYRFDDPSSATVDTLLEDEGTVLAGAIAAGGNDTIDLSRLSTSVTFDLTTSEVTIGLLTVKLSDLRGRDGSRWFENVIGSATAANHLFGNAADNLLVGGAAGDELDGRAGNDILIGNDNVDLLTGSGGKDLLIGGLAADSLLGLASRRSVDCRLYGLRHDAGARTVQRVFAGAGTRCDSTILDFFNALVPGPDRPTDGRNRRRRRHDDDRATAKGHDTVRRSGDRLAGRRTRARLVLRGSDRRYPRRPRWTPRASRLKNVGWVVGS